MTDIIVGGASDLPADEQEETDKQFLVLQKGKCQSYVKLGGQPVSSVMAKYKAIPK